MAGDDLDIRGGGMVAVDTETLRSAATDLVSLAGGCDDLAAELSQAAGTLFDAEVWIYPPTAYALDAAERARRLSADLQTMADTYELVELNAQRQIALSAGDDTLAAALAGRAVALIAANPQILWNRAVDLWGWETQTARGLSEQNALPGLPGFDVAALAALFAGTIGLLGRGAVPRGTTLAGESAPVSVTRAGGGRTTAPTSVTQVVDRVPGGDGRVRVERYSMPDGTRRFVAYIAGTTPGDEREAWDWLSNVQLYAGLESASSGAVRAALTDAGAAPGDAVSLVGYSQGAMIASYLTLSGDYDVPLLMTFGDPVQADVDENTLSVALRHNDDPVSALASGGFPGTVGAEGSFVASRDAPGTLLTGQDPIAPHSLDAYRATAQLLDASSDPRMDGVRAQFDDLAQAESVDVIVYEAERDPTKVDFDPYDLDPLGRSRGFSASSSAVAG